MKKLLLICCLFLTFLTTYQEFFNTGINQFNERHYAEAINSFVKSHQLKKHSKSSYYIAVSYFNRNQDSLANIYANRCLAEQPELADNYIRNLRYIIHFWDTEQLFQTAHIHIGILNSDEPEMPLTMEQKEAINSRYWLSTPHGQKAFMDDLMMLDFKSLPVVAAPAESTPTITQDTLQ